MTGFTTEKENGFVSSIIQAVNQFITGKGSWKRTIGIFSELILI